MTSGRLRSLRPRTQAAILGSVLLLSARSAVAQIVQAASCNGPDVQAALGKVAADGTTVMIPQGSCTWSTTLTYNQVYSTVLQGAGSNTVLGGGDKTTILDNLDHDNAGDQGVLDIQTATGKSLRVTGITFAYASSNTTVTYHGSLQIGGASQAVRVDHCHFQLINSTSATVDGPYGVFDHNLFDGSSTVSNFVHVYQSGAGGLGDEAWAADTMLGSASFFFFEDNTYTSGIAEDCTWGGRFVLRHNTMNGTSSQTHPTGGASRTRGCRSWEIYDNAFAGSNAMPTFNAFFLSAGTGVFWGNTSPAGYEEVLSIHAMRADDATYMQSAPPNGWGYCGTQVNGAGSPWDQNTDPASGYACLDQPGRGKGDLLANDFPNATNTVTTSTAWPHQALEPVYEWLDNWTAVPGYPLNVFDVYDSADLAANRDYYQYTTTFDGSSGVGSGTLAMRPASCTPLVAYWATDTNTLYQCTSANTWTTYYSPYVYPHPLDTSDDAGATGGADGGVAEGGLADDAGVPNDATTANTATDGGQRASSSSGGCGCRVAGAPGSKGVLATLGLGVLLTVGRRRRRGDSLEPSRPQSRPPRRDTP